MLKNEKNKKRFKYLTATLIMAVVSLIAFSDIPNADAATNGAGSQNDPVVTLSYLEYRLEKAGGITSEKKEDGESSASSGFTKVILQNGEILKPGEGGSLVMYSGNAKVYGESGLIDITDGTMYPEGCSLSLYNEYLIPEDGAGIEAMGKCTVFISR